MGASVTLTDANGSQKKATTNAEGVYSFAGLMPGKYTLQAEAPGFTNSWAREVTVTNQRQSLDVTLKVTIEERVTVNAETPVSTEANANANQQVIGGNDLDALPEDPDEPLPWWKVVLNPFFIANTGPPFNITTGQDLNLDRQYNERPSFVAENADCNNVNIRCTKYGKFNLRPFPGEQIIPRNYGKVRVLLAST